MSFNEKLQYLRKSNKLSQEQLADMLDVTRQSVSKWESGTTYPEMDKLITMCKIFKCSLDDLTNDEITQINVEKKSNNANIIGSLVNNIVDIVDRTVKMFRSMTAKQVVGVIASLCILAIFLLILRIPFEYVERGFYRVVSNISNKHVVGMLSGVFDLILDIIFFVLYVLAFVYIYKVAYLDKYDHLEEIDRPNSDADTSDDKQKKSETREVKIVADSSPKDNTLFCFLGNIVLWFMRILVAFCILPFIFTFVLVFAFLAILVFLMFEKIIYIGVLLAVIFIAILNLWLLETGCVFIFNKKSSFKRLLWTFLIGLAGLGISTGIITFEISNSNFVDSLPEEILLISKDDEFAMSDDFTIDDTSYYYKRIEYVVDDSVTDKVLISYEYYDLSNEVILSKEDNLLNINIYYSSSLGNYKKIWDLVKEDLSKRTFRNYDLLNEIKIKVTSSESNIAKIKSNSKNYLEDKMHLENQNDLYKMEFKISNYEEELAELREENEELKETLEEYKYRLKEILDN